MLGTRNAPRLRTVRRMRYDLFLALLDGVSVPEPDPDVYDENLAADPEVGA